MDIATITEFFKWCTIINGGILLLITLLLRFTQDLAYKVHNRWFGITRKHYTKETYHFLGVFKLIFILFNLTPYLALLAIS